MWPPIRKFQTGGRSRKFPADNAERMQIAFALFAKIVHIICKYVLHFYSILDRTRIRPGRENWPSSPFIRADLCTGLGATHKNRPNLGSKSNIVWSRQPPVSRCRVMRQCAGAEAEILAPIWAFFVPSGSNFGWIHWAQARQWATCRFRGASILTPAPRNHFPGIFPPKPKTENIFPFG